MRTEGETRENVNKEGPSGRKTEELRGGEKARVGGWGEGRECGRTNGFLSKEMVQYRLGRGLRKRDGASISVKRTEVGRKEQKEGGSDREERKEKSQGGKVRSTGLGA